MMLPSLKSLDGSLQGLSIQSLPQIVISTSVEDSYSELQDLIEAEKDNPFTNDGQNILKIAKRLELTPAESRVTEEYQNAYTFYKCRLVELVFHQYTAAQKLLFEQLLIFSFSIDPDCIWLPLVARAITTDDIFSVFHRVLLDKSREHGYPHYQICFDLVNRFKQLSTLPKLTAIEQMRIACFIQFTIKNTKNVAKIFFKKELEGLPMTLIQDPHTDIVYLLSKERQNFPEKIKSIHKKLRLVYRIPKDLNTKVSAAIQGVNRYRDSSIKEEIMRHIYLYTHAEKGIWQILYTYNYNKSNALFHVYKPQSERASSTSIEKAALIMPLGTSLETLIEKKQLPIQTSVQIAMALIEGLKSMHTDEYIHGSISTKHVLVELKQGHFVSAGFIGFRSSFIENNKPPSNSLVHRGVYSEPFATAPEVIGKLPFVGNCYAQDMWAFGMLLYCMCFQTNEAFTQDVIKKYLTLLADSKETKMPLDSEAVKKIKQEMHDIIQKVTVIPSLNLLVKETLTPERQFECLVYKILQENPNDRPDVRKVSNDLQKISASLNKN